MKVILSRKGFDSANGGTPSPILPDGTLLSLPIPSDDGVYYSELCCKGNRYSELLCQLNPKREYAQCHLDPDIRENVRENSDPAWKPAFGQSGASQGLLTNAQVEIGDLFLFFGWFRQTELDEGRYRYARRNSEDFYHGADLHVIYGYMQVGEILTDPRKIAEYQWHPHASCKPSERQNNALYLPSEQLSFLPKRKGYGVLDYREDRVLTKKNRTRAIWENLEFLSPQHVYGNKKNSAKGNGLYYKGIWQELVVFESDGLLDWVKRVIE